MAPLSVPTLPVRPAVVSTGPVFLLGDSLTVGVEPYLAALLPGRRVSFDAKVGRTTDQGVAIVKANPSELAPTVVVGLGTNDQTTAAEFAQNVDEMMALLGNRRVLWVNLARNGYSDFDAVLVAATEKYQNLELVDWASTYYSHPKVQATDGIHATEAGYQLRAQIIAAALNAPSPMIDP
jgi:lysophospholipase L1-like esterase